MVKIRLKQTGKKNAKTYRIVVVHSTNKRDGKQLDILGHYSPIRDKSEMVMDTAKADEWAAKGAVMTERVAKIYNLVKNNKLESN